MTSDQDIVRIMQAFRSNNKHDRVTGVALELEGI